MRAVTLENTPPSPPWRGNSGRCQLGEKLKREREIVKNIKEHVRKKKNKSDRFILERKIKNQNAEINKDIKGT